MNIAKKSLLLSCLLDMQVHKFKWKSINLLHVCIIAFWFLEVYVHILLLFISNSPSKVFLLPYYGNDQIFACTHEFSIDWVNKVRRRILGQGRSLNKAGCLHDLLAEGYAPAPSVHI